MLAKINLLIFCFKASFIKFIVPITFVWIVSVGFFDDVSISETAAKWNIASHPLTALLISSLLRRLPTNSLSFLDLNLDGLISNKFTLKFFFF